MSATTAKMPSGIYQSYDEQQLQLVKQQQDSMLERNLEEGRKYTKVKEDYVKLRQTLKTLPDTTNKEAMVPVGKKAFMPGRLVHTNEVLVLLGDNWFAERSAKQAGEMAARRIAKCDEMLKKLEKERTLVEGWRRETGKMENNGPEMEIREEFNEEEERRWRERHRERVREEKRKKQAGADKEDDAELWRRLDELEMEEELEEHLQREQEGGGGEDEEEEGESGQSSDLSESPPLTDDEEGAQEEYATKEPMKKMKKRRVSFASPEDEAVPTVSDLPGSSTSNNEPVCLVEFKHSNNAASTSMSDPNFGPAVDLLTPSDVDSLAGSKQTQTRRRSILKPFDPSEIAVRPHQEEGAPDAFGKALQVREPFDNPVGDRVVERKTEEEVAQAAASQAAEAIKPEDPPKKVSKFKQSRMMRK